MSPPRTQSDPRPVLVGGGSGRLGRLVVAGLLAQGVRVRVLSRQNTLAVHLAQAGVELSQGELGEPDTLQRALNGVRAAFLLSPISPDLARHQRHFVQAARQAGVPRLVKLSGSAWTLEPGRTWSGDAHREVEQALADSGLPHAVLRPNAWAQVVLAPLAAALRAGDVLGGGFGEAQVSYIDIRDIADVAVHTLLSPGALPSTPLELTGPEALSHAELAQRLSALSGRPIRWQAPAPAPVAPNPNYLQQVHAQFHHWISSGVAAPVTDTVARTLGRPARRLDGPEGFLRELLSGASVAHTHTGLA